MPHACFSLVIEINICSDAYFSPGKAVVFFSSPVVCCVLDLRSSGLSCWLLTDEVNAWTNIS